ncbi:hypothetical protein [Rhizobium sp.]
MVKLKHFLDFNEQSEYFSGDVSLKAATSGNRATLLFEATDAEIRFTGKNLSTDDGTVFDGGKVTGISIVNPADKTIIDITGLNIKASKLTSTFEESGVFGLMIAVTAGDDRVVGSGKANYLVGGAGDDVMTGKGGSDIFVFQGLVGTRSNAKETPQHDVITDFDVKGDDADRLFTQYGYLGFKPIHDGDDVRLKFEGGSTLVLEDVTKKEFQYWLDHNN